MKNSGSTYHSINVLFSITTYKFLTTGGKLYIACASIFACLHFISLYAFRLKPYKNHVKEISRNFKDPTKGRFGSSGKDRYFLKILKQQHNFFLDCKREKLVSYFLNNAAKTCLKFWRPLKLSMSFSLNQFFILVAISTQVSLSLFSILPKSRRQLLWVKSGLQRKSTKSVYHNILSELKLRDCYDY